MSDEEIKKLAAVLKGGDKDSFASFTTGLRSNWPFLIGVIGAAMWVFTNFNSQSALDLQQNAKIDTLTTSMSQLTLTVESLANRQENDSKNQGQIQQDIALIKADINTIKERIPKN